MNKKQIDPAKWELISEQEKDADKVSRPSLTYWQDVWRRLGQNKIAIIAMIVIIIVLILAIFIPMVWQYNYEEQRLEFSNVPPIMDIYDIGDNDYAYVTKDYKLINVSEKGDLLSGGKIVKDDKIARKYFYEINGKQVVVDYSLYFEAKKEYIAASKKGDEIDTKKVVYLRNYYNAINKKNEIITPLEANRILENEIDRYELLVDGKEVEVSDQKWNKTYIFGTDSLGRDIFIRIVYGARISLTIGFAAAFVNFFIGIFYGGIAGYFGGRLDNIMMRIVEIISSIPMMLYVILLMVIMKPGLMTIILALSITYWVGMARIVRGQILSLKEQEFVIAAKTLGASVPRLLVKHLIPNIMGPVMVSLTMQIPSAIFTEAFLSFVGLGVAAPKASWGTLANAALAGLYTYPYQMFFPAVAISVTILAFNLFGDGLRDALDPKLRK